MTPAEFRAAMRPLVMAAHRLKSDAPIERVLDKVERKVSSCVSNANTRAKKAGVPGRLTRDHVRQAFLVDYGKECPFTAEMLRYKNSELDHIEPLAAGGDNTPENVRLISLRANKIKENMSARSARILFEALLKMDPQSAASVTRRLMAKPKWR